MSRPPNPYLQQENYAAGYQKSVDNNNQNREILKLDRLCWEIFSGDAGKECLDALYERYVIPAFYNPREQNAEILSVYFDGMKQAYRQIKQHVDAHQQFIEAESKKNV